MTEALKASELFREHAKTAKNGLKIRYALVVFRWLFVVDFDTKFSS
jgi:hypothetical protein